MPAFAKVGYKPQGEKMKNYEVLFILKPTLTEDEAKQRVEFAKDIIAKNGGEVASVIEMGTRKLAYEIKKYERGTYFVIYFKAPPAIIEEIQRNLRNNEDFIRFLTVKYENKAEVAAWEKLSKGIKLDSIKRAPRREQRRESKEEEQKEDREDIEE